MAGAGQGGRGAGGGRPRAVRSLEQTHRRRLVVTTTARVVVAAVALLTSYYALPFDWAPTSHVWGGALTVLVLLAGIVLWPLRAVARSDLPELRAIEAVGFTVTFSVVLFASVYLVLSNDGPAAFSEPLEHTDALYLSMTTLTTVGFGDVSASSEAARVAVMLQMLTSFVLLSVTVRLVARVVRHSLGNGADARDGT